MNKYKTFVASHTCAFCSLLILVLNPEVSDTTTDAICTTAHLQYQSHQTVFHTNLNFKKAKRLFNLNICLNFAADLNPLL